MTRAKTAAVATSEDRIHSLAIAVMHALARPTRCTRAELAERLAGDGVTFNPSELDEVLARLEDVGQVVRVQRNAGYPLHIVAKGERVLDAVDELAADICSTLKRHGEQFENDEELRSYLDEDGVRYDPQSFAVALRQLEDLGRIRRLRVDDFGPDWKVPGVYVEPRIVTG